MLYCAFFMYEKKQFRLYPENRNIPRLHFVVFVSWKIMIKYSKMKQ